jgi:hypothetical protein
MLHLWGDSLPPPRVVQLYWDDSRSCDVDEGGAAAGCRPVCLAPFAASFDDVVQESMVLGGSIVIATDMADALSALT